MRPRRRIVAAVAVAFVALIAALGLHAFVRERYFADCSNGDGILGLLCSRERRPGWVDPLGVATLAVGIGLSIAIVRPWLRRVF